MHYFLNFYETLKRDRMVFNDHISIQPSHRSFSIILSIIYFTFDRLCINQYPLFFNHLCIKRLIIHPSIDWSYIHLLIMHSSNDHASVEWLFVHQFSNYVIINRSVHEISKYWINIRSYILKSIDLLYILDPIFIDESILFP